MDWGTIILLALAILGAGLVVSGVVAYRPANASGNLEPGWRLAGGDSAPPPSIEVRTSDRSCDRVWPACVLYSVSRFCPCWATHPRRFSGGHAANESTPNPS